MLKSTEFICLCSKKGLKKNKKFFYFSYCDLLQLKQKFEAAQLQVKELISKLQQVQTKVCCISNDFSVIKMTVLNYFFFFFSRIQL